MRNRNALSVVALAGAQLIGGTALADDCFSLRLSGCGKKARVCVKAATGRTAQERAIEKFRQALDCSAEVKVDSFGTSCSEGFNDRCNFKL
jgi:hypothetical protein